MDEEKNGKCLSVHSTSLQPLNLPVGFIVEYRPGKADITRVNTRSLSTTPGEDDNTNSTTEQVIDKKSEQLASTSLDKISGLRILAFKALPSRSSVVVDPDEPEISERQLVDEVCSEIQRVSNSGKDVKMAPFPLREAAIMSAQDAKKSAGLVEQWAYSLKRLVWG